MIFSQLTKITFSTLLAIVMIVSSTTLTVAQQDALPIKIDLFDSDIFILGQPEIVDEQRVGKPFPLPFQLYLAQRPNFIAYLSFPQIAGPVLGKITFRAGDPDDRPNMQFIENLTFLATNLPIGPIQERINQLKLSLSNEGFATFVSRSPEAKLLGARDARIGIYDVAEVFATYQDPAQGLVYVRMVGIPYPNGPGAIISVAHIVDSHFNITHIDDLARTGSGISLAEFTFLNE